MARYDHIDLTPPQGAREAARRALEVRAEKPESERGMTAVGIARARDLAAGRALSPETVRRMLAFFQRHEGDKDGSTWGEQGKGWQAWQGWGGDAGYAWARKVCGQMDAADEAHEMSDTTEHHVVPYEAHPVTGGDWDADAAVARLRKWAGVDEEDPSPDAWAKYARGFTVIRGPKDNLGSYLLPHHDVEGDHLVTPRAAVSAAIAALHGGRGGVDLPDDVKRAALAHLEQHRAAAEKATTARAPGVAVAMAESATVGHRTWNQVARLGTFRGHPQGQFQFTPQTFAELIANHNATVNGEVPVDYEHTSETLPESTAVSGVPAVAWVKRLEVRDTDGEPALWGEFEWVDPAAVDHVRTGRYRYLSPSVVFDATHRETGESIGARLTSVALTNHPFLDGMAPLTATARPMIPDDHDAIARAVVARLDARRLGLAPGEVHTPGGAEIVPPKPTRKTMKNLLSKMRARFGLADHAEPDGDEGALMAAFESMCSEFDGFKKAEDDRKKADAATMADRAVKDYGLPAAAKPMLQAQCMADRAAFDAAYPPKAAATARATDTQTLLSNRVAPQGTTPPAVSGAVLSAEDEDDQLATKLMAEQPARFSTYEAAVVAASEINRPRRLQAALQNLTGAR